ncbi:MAG: type II glyceraldehyde-3-phosphate dehydrogenase [Candidatus Aenigmatarchaeota archaeon]
MKVKPKVVVNGIGTIGKRVAHAIKLQDDIDLVAISSKVPNNVIKTVLEPNGFLYGTDLYASDLEAYNEFKKAGMWVNGTLEDLLRNGAVDVIIDCTPEGIGAQNKKNLYEKYGVKVIFQGGEKADVAEMTFNSFVNYEEAFDKTYVRVPSCNTTSLIRTLYTLDQKFGVEYVFVALARRANDPHEYKKGPIDAIEYDLHVPSHHSIDVKTVLKHLNIFSLAVKVPTTKMHVHMLDVTLKRNVSYEEIIDAFEKQTRIIFLEGKEYPATSVIIEKFRDYLRPRNDIWEVIVLKDLVHVENNKVRYIQAVHQEAVVIPENIDAIRAITGIEKDKWKSIEKTNKSLGILK